MKVRMIGLVTILMCFPYTLRGDGGICKGDDEKQKSISDTPTGYQYILATPNVGGCGTIQCANREFIIRKKGECDWRTVISEAAAYSPFYTAFILDDAHLWVTDTQEEMKYTETAGQTWKWSRLPASFQSLFFIDARRGWGARLTECHLIHEGTMGWGEQSCDANYKVWMTSDSGQTWSPESAAEIRHFYGLSEKEYGERFNWPQGKEIRNWLLKNPTIELKYGEKEKTASKLAPGTETVEPATKK